MADQTATGATGAASNPPAFDAAKFKQDLIDQTNASNKALADTIMTSVNAKFDGQRKAQEQVHAATKKIEVVDDDLIGFQEEMKGLNIDPQTAKSLTSFVTKVLTKKAPDFKKELKGEIEQDTSTKSKSAEKRAAYDREASMQFPQFLDQNSELHKTAKQAWNELTPEEQAMPAATYLAVARAAAHHGIKALTIEEIKAQQAQNNTGGNGGGGPKEDKISDASFDFAASFGVKDQKVYEAKLKQIKNKKRLA